MCTTMVSDEKCIFMRQYASAKWIKKKITLATQAFRAKIICSGGLQKAGSSNVCDFKKQNKTKKFVICAVKCDVKDS